MKKLGVFAVVAFALLLLAVYWFADPLPDPVTVPLTAGPSQPRIPATEAGIDPAALDLVVNYAAERNTQALIVGRNGHIVFEKYWGATTFDTPVKLSGFTPVLVAISTGSAMNDRLVPGIDTPLAGYVPGFEEGSNSKKTLRGLLTPDDINSGMGAWGVNIAAEAIERVTKQSYEAVVAERIWKPLEAGSFTMERRAAEGPGAIRASCCMTARIGDWMRLGELLANDGVFQANQLTPPKFVTMMLTPTAKDSRHGFLVRAGGEFAAHDVAWLESAGTQRMWLVPSLDLVILRIGADPPGDKGWDEAMIPDGIIRGTSGWQSAKGQGLDPSQFAPH
jgi:hypothetical protein